MKKQFLLISILAVSIAASAAVVSPERAMQVAQSFMPSQPIFKKNAKGQTAAPQVSQIVYTHYMPNSGRPAIYVVNIGNGFALVSADDVAHPILGYNYGKAWPIDGQALPPSVKGFLDDLAAQMEAASEHPQDAETAAEWQEPQKALRRSPKRTPSSLPDSVGPLLTTTWDQGQYYNSLCPTDGQGPASHVYTGCVATAMAQIIKYWGDKQTIKTRGIHSYDSNYGTLTVDFDSTEHDFANMPNALTSESTPEQVNAVAKLMYECGVAVNMGYSPYSSGAYDFDMLAAFINHFGFSQKLSAEERINYNDSVWLSLLHNSIDNGNPILYGGTKMYQAHMFVLDGYCSNGYCHFNYGWGGIYDGWYQLSSSASPNIGYTKDQKAFFNIVPIVKPTTICAQHGIIYRISEPFEIINIGSDNYGFSQMTMQFISEDVAQQLMLEIIDYQSSNITIYDGLGKVNKIRELLSMYADHDLSPIVSESHALTIVSQYIGDRDSYHFRVGPESSCRMVSNVNIEVNESSIQLSWQGNGDATSWRVEYGAEGFSSEDGISQITNNTSVELNKFLGENTTYEVRIQPACDIAIDKCIYSTIVNEKVYWPDIVYSEPEGYTMDDNGTIHISSAEGLAWLAKSNNTSHNVIIEANINLAGYLWEPISYWRGNWNGQGHVISNLHVISKGYGAGLFTIFSGDSICNIGFRNATIRGMNRCDDAGVISGYAYNTNVINCFVENFTIKNSGLKAGGLFGEIGSSNLKNCYVTGGEVTANHSNGGFFASGGCIMYNCYSSICEFGGLGWKGLISAYTRGGDYINCYADIDYVKDDWSERYIGSLYDADNSQLGYFFGHPGNIDHINNVAGFSRREFPYAYTIPDTALNYLFDGSVDLVTALNRGVIENNTSTLRTWVWDSITGLPIFGDFYEVTCPNIENIVASNIIYADSFAVAISWHENGDAQQWQIKCLPFGVSNEDSAIYYSSYATNDTLIGLKLGKKYDIYVRPVCDENTPVLWNTHITHLVDKVYWTDIVNTCPEGYRRDSEGNILISSAEGLAWFAVCSNGLNGQPQSNYEGESILLVNDIDLGRYKWKPISHHGSGSVGSVGTFDRVFMGSFNGNNHIISNIYCNAEEPHTGFIGLFGGTFNASISDVAMQDIRIEGEDYIGGLIGEATNSNINNCHLKNITIIGLSHCGGIVGGISYIQYYDENANHLSALYNSSVSGTIYGNQEVGGISGGSGNDCMIQNCYSTANIMSNGEKQAENKGGIVGTANGEISNCYGAGFVEYRLNLGENSIGSGIGLLYPNCSIGNIYSKRQEDMPVVGDCTWGEHIVSDTTSFNELCNLESPVVINEIEYTDLLSALNAWVDANNSEGKYRHWVADTENVNGGFPIFGMEDSPATDIDCVNANANANAIKVLYNGQILILRGDKIYTMTGQLFK